MTSPLTSHTTPHFSLNISPVEIVTPYLNTSAESLHVSPPSIFLFPTTPPSLQISSTVSTNPPIAPSTAPSTTPSGLLPFYQPCDKLKHKTLDQYLFEEEFVADSPLVETHDSTSNHAAGYSPSATTSLELLRKQVYESFLNEVQKRLRCVLKFKEICHLALRFIFNCMVDRSKPPMEEPIFFLHDATVAVPRLALAQLQKDLANHKADILASLEFIQCFRRACAEFNRKSSSGLVSKQMAQAELIDYDPAGFLTFRGRKYPDLADLGKLHSHARPEALALQIRYEYLHLSNHGLAFDYASNGHLKKDGLECFASAFNHYFDHYCSAFPDLEKAFGSLGSFFDQESPILQTHKTLYINPPFDESLVQAINDRVLSISGLKLHIVLPDWDNFTALEQLKHNPHTVSVNLYPKGTLKFLNFMTRPPQEIYPCNIALIRLDTGSLLNKASAKRKIDDEGPSQEDPPAKREKITDIKTAVE